MQHGKTSKETKGNPLPIYTHLVRTHREFAVAESFLIVLVFVYTHSITLSALVDLLQLIYTFGYHRDQFIKVCH